MLTRCHCQPSPYTVFKIQSMQNPKPHSTQNPRTHSMHGLALRWVAPEVLAGSHHGKAADVYAFGVILWEILTWQVPWDDLGPWQVQPCPCQRLVTRTLREKHCHCDITALCIVVMPTACNFPKTEVLMSFANATANEGLAQVRHDVTLTACSPMLQSYCWADIAACKHTA